MRSSVAFALSVLCLLVLSESKKTATSEKWVDEDNMVNDGPMLGLTVADPSDYHVPLFAPPNRTLEAWDREQERYAERAREAAKDDGPIGGGGGGSRSPCACPCPALKWMTVPPCPPGALCAPRPCPCDCGCKCAGGGNTPCPCGTKKQESDDDDEDNVDCKVTRWSEWSACNATCGTGVRFRTRDLIVNVSGNGRPCPVGMKEAQLCNTHLCPPTDCIVSEWNPWFPCSKSCGGGITNRVRRISQQPTPGGKGCPSLEEQKTCSTEQCSSDCVIGEWSPWSQCSKTCDGGQKSRERYILKPPKGDGTTCPSDLRQVQPCGTNPCPVDCAVGPWMEWTRCDKACDGGTRVRERRVERTPKNGGQSCPMPLKESEPCNTHTCPLEEKCVDCEVSEWGAWHPCSVSCGGGARMRERLIQVPQGKCGKPCPKLLIEQKECNTQQCPDPREVTAKFNVSIHFQNGYSMNRLFYYWNNAPGDKRLNENSYVDEWKNFPDEFTTLQNSLQELGVLKERGFQYVELFVGGYASVVGDEKENMILSEKRAKHVGCYVAHWLKRHGVKNFKLNIGFFGESLNNGWTPRAQAHDRRVDVFFPNHPVIKQPKSFRPRYTWFEGTSGGEIFRFMERGLVSNQASVGNPPEQESYQKECWGNPWIWQLPGFKDEWLDYNGAIKQNHKYKLSKASRSSN